MDDPSQSGVKALRAESRGFIFGRQVQFSVSTKLGELHRPAESGFVWSAYLPGVRAPGARREVSPHSNTAPASGLSWSMRRGFSPTRPASGSIQRISKHLNAGWAELAGRSFAMRSKEGSAINA